MWIQYFFLYLAFQPSSVMPLINSCPPDSRSSLFDARSRISTMTYRALLWCDGYYSSQGYKLHYPVDKNIKNDSMETGNLRDTHEVLRPAEPLRTGGHAKRLVQGAGRKGESTPRCSSTGGCAGGATRWRSVASLRSWGSNRSTGEKMAPTTMCIGRSQWRSTGPESYTFNTMHITVCSNNLCLIICKKSYKMPVYPC